MQAAQRMQRSMSWNSVPSIAERPLSTSTTWYSSGPSRSPGRRAPVRTWCRRRNPARWRSAPARAAGEVQSSSVGTIFSMLASTMCTRGRVCVRSPLPSLVTMTLLPVSAIRKLAPVMPTSAARNFSRSLVRASVRMSRRSWNTRSAGRSVWRLAELRLPVLAVQVERRRDDVAGQLVAKLDDVFAEVGLDRRDAVGVPGGR